MILDCNDIENNDEDFEIEKEDIKFKARRKLSYASGLLS